MGQLLPVLGNSRCGLKLPDSSVRMPSLCVGEGKHPLVASGDSHEPSNPQPWLGCFFKDLGSTSELPMPLG
jgi:hypothetical protein